MQLDADPDEAFTWKHCHGTFTILIDSGADEKLASSKGGDLKVMNKLVYKFFFDRWIVDSFTHVWITTAIQLEPLWSNSTIRGLARSNFENFYF